MYQLLDRNWWTKTSLFWLATIHQIRFRLYFHGRIFGRTLRFDQIIGDRFNYPESYRMRIVILEIEREFFILFQNKSLNFLIRLVRVEYNLDFNHQKSLVEEKVRSANDQHFTHFVDDNPVEEIIVIQTQFVIFHLFNHVLSLGMSLLHVIYQIRLIHVVAIPIKQILVASHSLLVKVNFLNFAIKLLQVPINSHVFLSHNSRLIS